MKKIITIAGLLFAAYAAKSQTAQDELSTMREEKLPVNQEMEKTVPTPTEGINFYVITKEKSKKLDLAALSIVLRAKIRGFFHRKALYVIIATSSEDAAEKIIHILRSREKMIANLWLDSHGHYGNRYSSFRVGTDAFNYKNINDTAATKYLRMISAYCDGHTKIGLGACYAGATYDFPATDSTAASPMHGDSLLIGLGQIFNRSLVYGSESWVMAKPGIFSDKFGFAGYPLQKRFLDSVYAPVWEHLGEWRQYSAATKEIKNVPTISLNRWGDIRLRDRNYQDLKKAKKAIAEKTSKLKHGLAKFS